MGILPKRRYSPADLLTADQTKRNLRMAGGSFKVVSEFDHNWMIRSRGSRVVIDHAAQSLREQARTAAAHLNEPRPSGWAHPAKVRTQSLSIYETRQLPVCFVRLAARSRIRVKARFLKAKNTIAAPSGCKAHGDGQLPAATQQSTRSQEFAIKASRAWLADRHEALAEDCEGYGGPSRGHGACTRNRESLLRILV